MSSPDNNNNSITKNDNTITKNPPALAEAADATTTTTPAAAGASSSSSSLPSSLSEHLNQCLKVTILEREDSSGISSSSSNSVSPLLSLEQQQQRQQLQTLAVAVAAQTTDAYVSFQGPYCQAHLPTLDDWNQQFRKAYTLLMWIRPRWMNDNDNNNKNDTTSSSTTATAAATKSAAAAATASDDDVHETTTTPTTTPRILYRFATDPDDAKAVGVAVTCSEWKVVYDNDHDHDSTTTTDKDNKDSSNNNDNSNKPSCCCCCYLETTLTAYALPHHKPSKVVAAGTATYSSWVQVPLRLKMPSNNMNDIGNTTNDDNVGAAHWHLLSFSHVFPYLKRPCWTVTLDGQEVGSGELHYPLLLNVAQQQQHQVQSQDHQQQQQQQQQRQRQRHVSVSKKHMEYNYLLHHVVTPAVEDQPSSITKAATTTRHWQLDLAAVSLYPEHIPANLQALCAEAGPNLCLQTADGRILPTLPPVCNWSKGSSFEGPKVGIPLTVHSVALDFQRLSSRHVFSCSAVTARVLGEDVLETEDGSHRTVRRIVWTQGYQAGAMDETPRVGLIQPSSPPAIRPGEEGEETTSLYISGSCVLVQARDEYVKNAVNELIGGADEEETCEQRRKELQKQWLQNCTPNLSVALAEQRFLSALVLPFFLSLCPPTKVFDMKPALYNKSLQQLLALYSYGGRWAAELIRTLAVYIQHGGGRVHEEVLQSGTLHALASSLRLGLLRAEKFKIFKNDDISLEDFIRQNANRMQAEEGIPSQSRQDSTAPSFIPPDIVTACVQLVATCCGPASALTEDLTPAMQVRRTSDLALTALFGFALDYDLWGATAAAAAPMAKCVAERYGGVCVTSGYILRSQMSVQHFLDAVRLRLDTLPASRELEDTANSLSQILQVILLASLLNRRSVSQGEHDISACVGALSDCPLGGCASHVVLNALVGVLVWCEIVPIEMMVCGPLSFEPSHDEERKMQVASKLGRNLLISQFHDVISPMILSRTAFSGERTMLSAKKTSQTEYCGSMCWQSHWRHALLLFSWAASIAGPDGIVASRSSGSLLLASGLAGSLKGCLEGASKVFISTLFLPPPGMALMIGSAMRDEWSYSDLLADRLQIMMPLVPGMIASLLSSPSGTTACGDDIPRQSVVVLSEVLTSVAGAFHRVFGGVVHSTEGSRTNIKKRGDGASLSIKAAKSYVPHLLTVAMLLEDHIVLHQGADTDSNTFEVLRPHAPQQHSPKHRTDSDSWVGVPSTTAESFVNELIVSLPDDETQFDSGALIYVLRSCQRSALNTAAGLISTAMNVGGAGTTTTLWQNVLSTLHDSVASVLSTSKDDECSNRTVSSSEEKVPVSHDSNVGESSASSRAKAVLSRLIGLVLRKALKRDNMWDTWGYEMSSAVSTTCLLIEEKALLAVEASPDEKTQFSPDQVILLFVLTDVLAYGRESTGWCQLALPSMPSPNRGRDTDASHSVQATSKLLLPVLQPCFRLVLASVPSIGTNSLVRIPTDEEDKYDEESLLARVLSELDRTLTAAIVGLTFSSARDAALNTLATLRRTMQKRLASGDQAGAQLCGGLICKVAEELRARYESERRLRENALFDAYEDNRRESVQEAAEASQAVERLILGEGMFGQDSSSAHDTDDHDEEIAFDHSPETAPKKKASVSEDFVLFHEPSSSSETKASEVRAKLGFPEYQGLGDALEKIRTADSSSIEELSSAVVKSLETYLNNWDAAVKREEAESELVKLFDANVGLGQNSGNDVEMFGGSKHISASETAADAMSSFFEFAAVEKSRLKEVTSCFLPSHRYSIMSFAERFCWSAYMGFSSESIDKLWERGMPDGNRDIRSRIATFPCFPQFRPYIPGYLDHGPSPAADVDAALFHEHRRSSAPAQLDEFTKTLLEAGNLEIVDITKKATTEDDEPDITIPKIDSLDEDDAAEMFTETDPTSQRPMTSHEVPADDSEREPSFSEELSAEEIGEKQDVSLSEFAGKGQHIFTTSSFSTAPDNASSSIGLMRSAAAGLIDMHLGGCLHVKPEGSRPCTMLLTSTHLILEYEGSPEGFFEGEILAAKEEAERLRMIEDAGGSKDDEANERYQKRASRRLTETASLRPKSVRYNLSEVSHIYLRRYRLRDSSIEIFFIPSGGASYGGFGLAAPTNSVFVDFGGGSEGNTRRDDAAFAIMRRTPAQAVKQWPDRSGQFLHEQLSRLTIGWAEGRLTNFDYLLHLNMLAGRTYNDICQYPVFPWVLADYTSEEVPDLADKDNFRDLSKPIGALNPERLEVFKERFDTFADPSIPPFMYGSHYSTSAGVVLHFLVRLHPFAGLHRQLQGGHFDVADRLFSSIPRTWAMCTGSSAAEVKEITPEWYCNPGFLRNANSFKLGTSQDGELLGDVVLPPWAEGSPEKFVEIMRAALESDVCSEMLPQWIDLIFGYKQQGPESIKAHNVYFYLTYYGAVDVASIKDESLRHATELQIAHFGQCPMQLFRHRPHIRRLPRRLHRLPFYQLVSIFHVPERRKRSGSNESEAMGDSSTEETFLPFYNAPLSHWVHLDAPPPGPHSALQAVRFAGTDRCLAVDSKGIFHTFRWTWRPEDASLDNSSHHFEDQDFSDKGWFVAQRELPRFRSVPRLIYSPSTNEPITVAISKTLFAGRSVLLVLSDGDGCGALGIQLVDPSKGNVRGEVTIPHVHSARITCIATDPIGTAAGHGGVGGELAIVGSADGNASIWRFMSSHYLPLRPRILLHGHSGAKLSAVALCTPSQIGATVSSQKCCLHSITNGSLMRCIDPPKNAMDALGPDVEVRTKFADTPALAISVQGFIICVCESTIKANGAPDRTIATLNLLTLEGVSLGSMPLEPWRGLPHKIQCIPDGTAVLVCHGRGVTIHRVSSCKPFEIIDEWHVTESDDLNSFESITAAWDIDLGPSLNRPVVAAAACSNGALRLHALPGISQWSVRHTKKTGILSQTVGSALAKPARRLKSAVKGGFGFGRQIADMGREIGREVSSDVKERGVGGFLNNMMFGKNNNNNNSSP